MSQRAVDINVSTLSDDDQPRNAGAEAQSSDPEYGRDTTIAVAEASQQPLTSGLAFFDSGGSSNDHEYSRHVLLSCFVVWCCCPGCFCGLAAYVLTRKCIPPSRIGL